MAAIPLAHSEPPDPYDRHVKEVVAGGKQRAENALRYYTKQRDSFLQTVVAAASYHDLGKLDPENQAALEKGKNFSLPWDHIDAGVALMANRIDGKQNSAMWLIRGHHAPGFPAE